MVNPFEFSDALDSMVILTDTREQPTAQAERRYKQFGVPYERHKLDFGDYSAKFLVNGEWLSIEQKAIVERKMGLGELCMCYCQERKRFEREFERIKESGARCYLLIEDATWEHIYAGKYRSQMRPNSLVASVLAYTVRYNAVPIFCRAETSGRLIHDILYREGKEFLERYMDDADNHE